MHEPDFIHHSFEWHKNYGVMEPGHVFTIEPIIQMYKTKAHFYSDNWTAYSIGCPSA